MVTEKRASVYCAFTNVRLLTTGSSASVVALISGEGLLFTMIWNVPFEGTSLCAGELALLIFFNFHHCVFSNVSSNDVLEKMQIRPKHAKTMFE